MSFWNGTNIAATRWPFFGKPGSASDLEYHPFFARDLKPKVDQELARRTIEANGRRSFQ